MSTATSGRAREYRVRDDLVSHGYACVMRSAASKGAADLLHGHIDRGAVLVQVGTASKVLSPADRLRFVTAADLIGAIPVLAIAPRRQPIRYWTVTIDTPSKWEEWTP